MPQAAELEAEERGPPRRVAAAEVQGRVMHVLLRTRSGPRPGAVARGEEGARAEAGDQRSEGADREGELVGDLAGGLSVLPAVAECQADGGEPGVA
ncbi:MAG: hypothetical protein JWO38_6898 [Gemmataceae bacterium]|nr:hypothetical protein [Gemmataceae bacterium]